MYKTPGNEYQIVSPPSNRRTFEHRRRSIAIQKRNLLVSSPYKHRRLIGIKRGCSNRPSLSVPTVRCVARVLLCKFLLGFVVLSIVDLVGTEVSSAKAEVEPKLMQFSYGNPSTFRHGSEDQQRVLRSIAESEFSLDHLPEYERELVSEALDKSGIEVQDACRVDMSAAGSLGAFFIRRKHHERTRFDPNLGVFETPSKKKKDTEPTVWKRINGDYTEYPYPFGDARLIPKVIPVNLSSISVVDRDETRVKFVANPSALLFAKMPSEERILSAEQLSVEIDVDRSTRRVSRLTLYLPEGVRVYRGIRITNLKFEYEFDDDRTVDRNVLKRVNHAMRGRIGGVFRPNFSFTTDLSYNDCVGARDEHSYLYAAIESIRALD